MATDPSQSIVPPSEQRGGTTATPEEAREKGDPSGQLGEGIVPPEQGGSDAPREMLGEDPELASSVLGATTGSDEPATEGGVDLSLGDNADATSHGGANVPDEDGVEPDVKDGAGLPGREADRQSAV
jgi:hypothetical protein